tara:strand:- start:670 stop:783 length:114 start_codon:yes stop_codon:yes gene_type:complete
MSHEYIKFEIDKDKSKMFIYQAAKLDGVISVEILEEE